MKILVFPREAANPYQLLLYQEMQSLGARVTYLGVLTRSATLNLLLLPLELAIRRMTGSRVLHLHWVFGFGFPNSERFVTLRRLAQVWFVVFLWTVRCLGIRLIWTAHNVLPHEPVFADDRSARVTLVAASDLVIVHSEATLAQLKNIGAIPSRSVLIPHGPFRPYPSAGSLREPGTEQRPRHFLFFGNVHSYKGVEDLLAAFNALPDASRARLTIAGQCKDPELRMNLTSAARLASGDCVTLQLERLADKEVSPLLESADVVVLPYRRITTSGSAMLALAHGRPLVVPDVQSLSHLPSGAVVRFNGSIPDLTAALERLCVVDASTLRSMSASAREYADAVDWPIIAAKTWREIGCLRGPASIGQPDAATRGVEGGPPHLRAQRRR